MKITLSPIRSDVALTLSKVGDVLTVNGEEYDLVGIPEGATLPQSAVTGDWLASDISRVNGALEFAVMFPHGPNAPQAALFPDVIDRPPNGEIALPIANIEPEMETE